MHHKTINRFLYHQVGEGKMKQSLFDKKTLIDEVIIELLNYTLTALLN